MERQKKDILQKLFDVKRLIGIRKGEIYFEELYPDGSDRYFFRLVYPKGTYILLYNPKDKQENERYVKIARYLSEKGVPVPAIIAHDFSLGWIIMEDLGTIKLHELVVNEGNQEDHVRDLYKKVILVLIQMERGAIPCDHLYNLSLPIYDIEIIKEREIGYFKDALLIDFMGIDVKDNIFREEAKYLLSNISHFKETDRWLSFMHRDFQSRNIIIKENGEIGIVDFQGAMWGPYQYDLASLLFDPYVELKKQIRDEMLSFYMSEHPLIRKNIEEFMTYWPYILLFRLMQALGAYGFLVGKKGKDFFVQFIHPATRLAIEVIQEYFPGRLNYLRDIFFYILER